MRALPSSLKRFASDIRAMGWGWTLRSKMLPDSALARAALDLLTLNSESSCNTRWNERRLRILGFILERRPETALARLSNGRTLLLAAANVCDAPALEMLLPRSDPSAVDFGGSNAMMLTLARDVVQGLDWSHLWLMRSGYLACANVLVGAVDPHHENPEGDTALSLAAKIDCPSVVALLAPSSRREQRNQMGLTPLMIAAMHGRQDCVEALLPWSDIEARQTLALGDGNGGFAGSTAGEFAAKLDQPLAALIERHALAAAAEVAMDAADGSAMRRLRL